MTITARLKQLCDDAGMARHGSGKRLSVIAGVSVKTGNKWINGVTVPTLKSIVLLSAFFGVRAEWLLSGDGDKYVAGRTVNAAALLSDYVAKSAACSSLVVKHLRIISLAALNGDLVCQDTHALERIVERLERRAKLRAA